MRMQYQDSYPLRLAGLMAAALSVAALAGCVTTQAQADGSTRVNVSVAQALGLNKAEAVPATTAPAAIPRPAAPAAMASKVALVAAPAGKALSSLSRKRLEEGLMCKEWTPFPGKTKKIRDKANDDYYPALIAAGLNMDDYMFDIPNPPLTVFGMPVSKVRVAAESFEVVYRSYFPSATKEMLIKAANLKLGKDKETYSAQSRKGGTLTLEKHDNVWTLSCLTYSH